MAKRFSQADGLQVLPKRCPRQRLGNRQVKVFDRVYTAMSFGGFYRLLNGGITKVVCHLLDHVVPWSITALCRFPSFPFNANMRRDAMRQWSSFHRWVRASVYSKHWACGERDEIPSFNHIEKTVGE